MTSCKKCKEEIGPDDRRWNNNPHTVYCRECVSKTVFDATTKKERFLALKEGKKMASENKPDWPPAEIIKALADEASQVFDGTTPAGPA